METEGSANLVGISMVIPTWEVAVRVRRQTPHIGRILKCYILRRQALQFLDLIPGELTQAEHGHAGRGAYVQFSIGHHRGDELVGAEIISSA